MEQVEGTGIITLNCLVVCLWRMCSSSSEKVLMEQVGGTGVIKLNCSVVVFVEDVFLQQ